MRDPKHILITGASSGIGAALATEYAAPGVVLSLHGRNAERLAQVAELARGRGGEVETHSGDTTDAADMAAWIAARDAATPVDVLIANAAISVGTAKGGENAQQIKQVFAVNVDGTFNTIQPIIPLMIGRRRGQIAIVSSVAGFYGLAGSPAYCATKAAMRVYGEGLRPELAAHQISVNVVCPGFVKTPMTDVNDFPMPFLMTPAAAARIIRQGLARDRARIVFPWRLYAMIRLLESLPQGLRDRITAGMPKK